MNANTISQEQINDLVQRALVELLAKQRRSLDTLGPVGRQEPAWVHPIREEEAQALLTRAEIYRLLD